MHDVLDQEGAPGQPRVGIVVTGVTRVAPSCGAILSTLGLMLSKLEVLSRTAGVAVC